MAAPRRAMLIAAALCAGLGLSGCANGNFELDPAYWFPDGKKKLPGERREVFPGGVPGVTQGIPPELIRGNPAQSGQEQALAPQAEEPPPSAAQERPKPRPRQAARPRPAPPPEPAAQAAPAQPAQGAWPAPQAQQAPQAPAPTSSGWPAPPAAGTFTR